MLPNPDIFRSYRQEFGEELAEKVVFGFPMVAGVDVTLERYRATITWFRPVGCVRRIDYEAKFCLDEARSETGFYGPAGGDRKVSVTFGIRTLLAAHGATVADEDTNFDASGAP